MAWPARSISPASPAEAASVRQAVPKCDAIERRAFRRRRPRRSAGPSDGRGRWSTESLRQMVARAEPRRKGEVLQSIFMHSAVTVSRTQDHMGKRKARIELECLAEFFD